MKLEEYIKALKECEDHLLRTDLDIYDNWPILLKADFDSILQSFHSMKKYKFKGIYKLTDHPKHMFISKPEKIPTNIYNFVGGMYVTGLGMNNTEEDRIEAEKQKRDYNITILLHPFSTKYKDENLVLRKTVHVIEDITEFIIKENIPACMPFSVGDNYRKPLNVSKIVYHMPKTK